MFMVEANEAVARLLDSLGVPFLRRAHAEPAPESSDRLRQFVQVSGYRLGKEVDRKTLQALLETVKGKPEAFAINLAVLKSLARAEYTPEVIGHYALASEHYGHFTSPIRRYADLTVHRLLDEYFKAREKQGGTRTADGQRRKVKLEHVVPFDELVELGKHLAMTERRADDAENELRQVKLLELLSGRIGDEFHGVVTSVTKFGIFIQLTEYLVDGLIRYEELMDDYWDVDERGGFVRGKRTQTRIAIGDQVKAVVAKVDVPRRELSLQISELIGHPGRARVIHAEGEHGKKKGHRGAAEARGRGGRGGRKQGGQQRHEGRHRESGGGGGGRRGGSGGGGGRRRRR
jgi:ribonuclease R